MSDLVPPGLGPIYGRSHATDRSLRHDGARPGLHIHDGTGPVHRGHRLARVAGDPAVHAEDDVRDARREPEVPRPERAAGRHASKRRPQVHLRSQAPRRALPHMQRGPDPQPPEVPKGSQIGSGTALGILGGSTDNPTKEPITVTMFNGPKGKSITFRIKGDAPAVIDVPFDAPLKTFSSGSYNYQLTVNVPDILQIIAGIPVSLDFFNVKVGATRNVHGKKRGYIETLICPPLALVPIQGDFGFLNADPFHIDTYIHCG